MRGSRRGSPAWPRFRAAGWLGLRAAVAEAAAGGREWTRAAARTERLPSGLKVTEGTVPGAEATSAGHAGPVCGSLPRHDPSRGQASAARPRPQAL